MSSSEFQPFTLVNSNIMFLLKFSCSCPIHVFLLLEVLNHQAVVGEGLQEVVS